MEDVPLVMIYFKNPFPGKGTLGSGQGMGGSKGKNEGAFSASAIYNPELGEL
jgi:hypothetical protein